MIRVVVLRDIRVKWVMYDLQATYQFSWCYSFAVKDFGVALTSSRLTVRPSCNLFLHIRASFARKFGVLRHLLVF